MDRLGVFQAIVVALIVGYRQPMDCWRHDDLSFRREDDYWDDSDLKILTNLPKLEEEARQAKTGCCRSRKTVCRTSC